MHLQMLQFLQPVDVLHALIPAGVSIQEHTQGSKGCSTQWAQNQFNKSE
jgi:hypothetical protein